MATNHLKFWGVRALDLHDGTDKLVPHASEIVIALYNTTFDLILTGDRNGLVSLWNVKTGAQQFKFYCESVQVQIVKFFYVFTEIHIRLYFILEQIWEYYSGDVWAACAVSSVV